MLEADIVRRAVRAALEEDLGPGDITSRLVLDAHTTARGIVIAREPVTVAGLPVAREVFHQVDPALEIEAGCEDGDELAAGARVATVRGSARSILAAERTALNFLQRLSGIATRWRSRARHGSRYPIPARRRRACALWTGTRCGPVGGRTTVPVSLTPS